MAHLGCGQLSTYDEYSINPYLKSTSTKILSINYYKEAGYSIAPNWSHDITISFLTNGSAFVDSLDPAKLNCGNSGIVSYEQINVIVDLINSLNVTVQPPGISLLDGGIETVKITYVNGTTKTIHLTAGSLVAGEYLATNGDALSQEIVSLPPTLLAYCN